MELNLKPRINCVYLVLSENRDPVVFESEDKVETYLNANWGSGMNRQVWPVHPMMMDVAPPAKDIAILKYNLVEDSRFKDLDSNVQICKATMANTRRVIDNVFFVVTEVNGGVVYLSAFESDVDADNWINKEHKDRASEFKIVSLKIKKVYERTN